MQYLGFADKRVACFAGLYPITSILLYWSYNHHVLEFNNSTLLSPPYFKLKLFMHRYYSIYSTFNPIQLFYILFWFFS